MFGVDSGVPVSIQPNILFSLFQLLLAHHFQFASVMLRMAVSTKCLIVVAYVVGIIIYLILCASGILTLVEVYERDPDAQQVYSYGIRLLHCYLKS